MAMNSRREEYLLPQGHSSDTILAWWQGRAVTAAEFLQHVDFVAANLPPADAALNLCEDRYLFMVTFVALLRCGQVNVLPPNRAPQVVAEVAADYDGAYYLAEHPMPGLQLRFHQVILPEKTARPHDYMPRDFDAEQVACMLYTSGSTGKPAPNPKAWRSLVAGSAATRQRLGAARLSGATVVATVPAQHMFGLEFTVLLPLLGGCAVYAGRPFFPEDVRYALESVPEPRLLVTTPLHLRACVEAGLEWPAIARVISATAPLHRALAQDAEHVFGCEVTEIFGSTETGAIASRRPVRDDLWQALPQVVFSAGQDAATVQAPFLPGPIGMNDAVELQSDHSFLLLGRNTDMINIAGKRASLGDLTHKLLQICGVEDAVMFQQAEDSGGVARLCALVVAPGLEIAALQRELLQRFDPVFIPRPLYRVERLPRNAAGKLPQTDLQTLVQRLRESHETQK